MEPAKNLPAPEQPVRLFGSTLAADEKPLPAGLFWAGLLLFGSAGLGLLTMFLAPDYAGRGLARFGTHVFFLFDVVAAIFLVRRDERLVIPVIVRAVAGILLHVAFGLRLESAHWLVYHSAFHVAVVVLLVGEPRRARIVAGMLLGVVPLAMQLQLVTSAFHRTLVRAATPEPQVAAEHAAKEAPPVRRPFRQYKLAEFEVSLPSGWRQLETPTIDGAAAEFVSSTTGGRVFVYRWPEPYADSMEFFTVVRKTMNDLPSALLPPNGSEWQLADGAFLVRRFAEAKGVKTLRNVETTFVLHARAERATRFAVIGIAPRARFGKSGVTEVMTSFRATGLPALATTDALPAAVDAVSPSIVQIDGSKELETGVIVAQRGDEFDAVCVHRWIQNDQEVKVAYAGPDGTWAKADGKVVAFNKNTNLALVRFRAAAGTRTVAKLAPKVALAGPTEVHLVGFPAAGGFIHPVAPLRLAGPWGGETPARGRFDLLDAPYDRRLSGSAIVAGGEVLGIAVIDLDDSDGPHGIDTGTIRAFLQANP